MSGKKEHFPGFVDPPSPLSPVEEWKEFARSIEPMALEYEDMQRELEKALRIIAERKASDRNGRP